MTAITRSTPSSYVDLLKPVSMSVRPYVVRTSVRPPKLFSIRSKFGTWVGDDEFCYTTLCRLTLTRSKVKVKVTKGRKLRKLPISKSTSSAGMRVINGELCYSRKYLNIFRTGFWYSSSFGVTWPSKLGCYDESTGSPVWGLFLAFRVLLYSCLSLLLSYSFRLDHFSACVSYKPTCGLA